MSAFIVANWVPDDVRAIAPMSPEMQSQIHALEVNHRRCLIHDDCYTYEKIGRACYAARCKKDGRGR